MRFGPAYNPPYDSPIEDRFAWNVVKYFDVEVSFRKQVEAVTSAGTFRLDFVLERFGFSVAVECDGAAYHEQIRDEWRDALILNTHPFDAIVRLRGSDLLSRIEDALFLFSDEFPSFFTDKGRWNIRQLASYGLSGFNPDGRAGTQASITTQRRAGKSMFSEMMQFAAAHPEFKTIENLDSEFLRMKARNG